LKAIPKPLLTLAQCLVHRHRHLRRTFEGFQDRRLRLHLERYEQFLKYEKDPTIYLLLLSCSKLNDSFLYLHLDSLILI
jgi:hypothetical protein